MRAIVETPEVDQAPSNLLVLGRYVLPPRTWDLLKRIRRALAMRSS